MAVLLKWEKMLCSFLIKCFTLAPNVLSVSWSVMARQQVHAERGIVTANPYVCPSVCLLSVRHLNRVAIRVPELVNTVISNLSLWSSFMLHILNHMVHAFCYRWQGFDYFVSQWIIKNVLFLLECRHCAAGRAMASSITLCNALVNQTLPQISHILHFFRRLVAELWPRSGLRSWLFGDHKSCVINALSSCAWHLFRHQIAAFDSHYRGLEETRLSRRLVWSRTSFLSVSSSRSHVFFSVCTSAATAMSLVGRPTLCCSQLSQ